MTDEAFTDTIEKALRRVNPGYQIQKITLYGHKRNPPFAILETSTELISYEYAPERYTLCYDCTLLGNSDYGVFNKIDLDLSKKKYETPDLMMTRAMFAVARRYKMRRELPEGSKRFSNLGPRSPANVILVVTGDKVFHRMMMVLRARGIFVMLAQPEATIRFEDFFDAWSTSDLLQGDAPTFRNPQYQPPV